MEKAFREKKCISSKIELARFHQGTDDIYIYILKLHIVEHSFFLCCKKTIYIYIYIYIIICECLVDVTVDDDLVRVFLSWCSQYRTF